MYYCAQALGRAGLECALYGFDSIPAGSLATKCTALSGCIANSRAVILPVPLSKDGIYLDTSNVPIKLSDVFSKIPEEAPVFAGAVNGKAKKCAEEFGITLYDYMTDECLARKNAYATAEGAIMLAMQYCSKTLKDTSFLVCGYGRIGGYTAKLLKGFGAKVTVLARREISRVEAETDNLESISPEKLADKISGYECIINTVPENIFTEKELSKMSSEQIYIELASAPYGVSGKLAAGYNIEIVNGAALPSRYCPESGGEFIAEILLRELERSGII